MDNQVIKTLIQASLEEEEEDESEEKEEKEGVEENDEEEKKAVSKPRSITRHSRFGLIFSTSLTVNDFKGFSRNLAKVPKS